MNKPVRIAVELKVEALDGALGLALPLELLEKLGVREGDSLYLRETDDGELRISTAEPSSARQLDLAAAIMASDRAILRVLAQ